MKTRMIWRIVVCKGWRWIHLPILSHSKKSKNEWIMFEDQSYYQPRTCHRGKSMWGLNKFQCIMVPIKSIEINPTGLVQNISYRTLDTMLSNSNLSSNILSILLICILADMPWHIILARKIAKPAEPQIQDVDRV